MKTPRWIFKATPRAQATVAAVLLLLLLILVYPFQTTIVPEWSLKVVDEEGAPARDVNVTEHWQHYLVESSSHEDVQRSGADGRVSFPARSIRLSLVGRAWATISRIKRDGWHARRTPAASVVVWGNKDYATTVAVYNPAELPPSHVIVPAVK